MRTLPLLMVLGLAAPASAIQLGFSPTFGSSEYKNYQLTGLLDIGGLSLQPEVSQLDVKGLGDPYKTAQVRVGLDLPIVSVGVTGGLTPESNGYKNVFGGADVSLSLKAAPGGGGRRRIGGAGRTGGAGGKGLGRVDVGAGVMATKHDGDAGILPDVGVTQSDIFGFVGASVVGIEVSARLTKSSYSGDAVAGFANTPRTVVAGHIGPGFSFPDTSFHARVDVPFFPLVRPWGSLTKTSYETAGTGDTTALAVGASLGLEMLEVSAAYQRIAVSGGSDSDFLGLGAALRFGLD